MERGFVRRPASLVTDYRAEWRLIPTPFAWFWTLVGLGIAVSVPFVLGRFHLHLVNLSLIAVVGAVALNLLTGNAGLVSLGQSAFLAAGAFTAGVMADLWEVPFLLILLASALVGALLGLLVGIPSLRLKALYIAVTTFALHFAVLLGITELQRRVSQYAGISMPEPAFMGAELQATTDWYGFLLLVALLSVIVAANLRRSRVGRVWTAIHDHEIAAEALGVGLTRAKLSVFVFSSSMVAFAGALAGYYSGVVSSETYDLQLAIAYLAMIIIGGMGRVLGSVLGAFFVIWLPYVVEAALRMLGIGVGPGRISGLQTTVFACIVVLFLLLEPGGLAEIWRRLRDLVTLWPFRALPLQERER